MMRIRRRTLFTGLAALPLLRVGDAQAQAWPVRPVRLVIGFPAGGGVDVTMRPLAQHLGERLGQQFVVENRGGANGNIAMEAVARAPADGYTLMAGSSGMLAINPALYRDLTFDTITSFAPVAKVVAAPLAVAVPADLPVRTPQELVAYARARPGQLNMGSGGNGGISHLAFELLKRRTGTDMVHVPYRGSAPALQDLIGGRVQLMVDGYSLMRSVVEAGRVRVIATTGLERLPALPDVPTVHETVAPGFEAISWQGIVAPAGTPDAILSQLEGVIGEALRTAELQQLYLSQGQFAAFLPRSDFAAFIRRQREQWTRIIQEARISLD